MKTFIQIGTNNGDDDFYNIVSNLSENSKIILIEPQLDLIPLIKKRYDEFSKLHEIIILNNGVVHDKKINVLYKYEETTNGVLSSVISRKSYNYVKDTISFDPITISEICEKYDITKIDLLYIDTEGYDYMIMDSLDLNSLYISEIICEIWPYNIDSNETIKTGPEFFDQIITPKFGEYDITKYDCCNYKFTKKYNK